MISFSTYAESKWEKKSNLGNKYIASKWRLINRNVDMFFSNSNYDENENNSSISFYSITTAEEHQKIQNDFDFQLKVDFPQTSKNLKLVIEKDQDEVKKAMTDESISISSNKKANNTEPLQKYSTAINYLINNSSEFTSMVKFGLRIDMPLNPSVKYNAFKNIEFNNLSIDLNQDFILYRQEGFLEISSINLGYMFNEKLQIELNNKLAWTDKDDLFQLRNSVILYQTLINDQSLTYSIGANATLSPVFNYQSYDTSVSYHRKLFGNWLYATSTIGADFFKSYNFRMDKFIQIRLEIFFK